MNNIANQQQIILAEDLISLVARAFYNDNVIVLIDLLLYEKYIVEEEMAPRCQMTNKELAKIKNLLEKEGLIRYEDVPIHDETGKSTKTAWKCYYIDYQQFIHLLRLRIYYMQKSLEQEEKMELNDVYYQCPTCGNKYSSLDAQKLRAGDYKFVCSNCFPGSDFRTVTKTEEYYRLIQIDNRKTVNTLQSLQKKLDDQLNTQKVSQTKAATTTANNNNTSKNEVLLHTGIFQLLHQLRDVELPRNLPSENINKGILASAVSREAASEIAYNIEAAKRGKYGSHISKKTLDQVKLGTAGVTAAMSQYQQQTTFTINILPEGAEETDTSLSGLDVRGTLAANTSNVPKQDALEASLPEFVQGSHVFRADQVLESISAMQNNRDGGNKSIGVKHEASRNPEEEKDRSEKKTKIDPVVTMPPDEGKPVIKEEKTEQAKPPVEEEDDLFGDVEWEQEEES